MKIIPKHYNLLFKTSMTLLLLSAFSMPLKADIVFDFYGNHAINGKSRAVLRLKNSYLFTSDITANNMVKLKFYSASQQFTIYPREISTIYASLDIDGKVMNSPGNFQFYLRAANNKFFGTRRDGTWRAENDQEEGNSGRWVLRLQGFKHVCLSRDNFHKAAGRGDLDYLNECLRAGIHVDRKEGNGWTALHSAASKGNINIVKSLLRHRANRFIKDNSGRTPRDHAVRAKNYDMIAILDKG